MVSNYDYKGLSDKAKEFTIAQLHEDPLTVNEHIEKLRKWVESQSHLLCPKDSKFLLRFLRVAKFDHKKAQERLDNFCTTSEYTDCFDNPEIDDSKIKEYLDKPIVIPLGRTDDGEMVVLMRTNVWDPDTISFAQYLSLIYMTLDILMEEEETQIFGIRFIIDVSNMTRKALVSASNRHVLKNVNLIWHESFPMRLKGEVYYNNQAIFENVFNIYLHYMDHDTKRCMIVANDKDTLLENISGLEKILPKEYGGQGDSIKEIGERSKKQFLEYYKNGIPLANVGVDESKRPEGASYLSKYSEYEGPIIEIE